MASIPNPNGLRAMTGGQAGTMDLQFVLIACYNSAFNLTPTQTVPSNNYEYISDSNDGFAQIMAVVQDFAEVYYVGIPEANSGGENDLTRLVVAINPFTARDLPTGIDFWPTATGQWDALINALNDAISGGSAQAWFAMPGNNWSSGGWSWDN